MRTESTFLRIACKNEVGIILRFVGIPLRIGGTRSPEYSAIQAAAATEQAYASLYNAGALADRTDAVYNLMNCACVYSGCGDNQRALALLEKILSGYVPENEQEQIVFDTVKRKYRELKAL